MKRILAFTFALLAALLLRGPASAQWGAAALVPSAYLRARSGIFLINRTRVLGISANRIEYRNAGERTMQVAGAGAVAFEWTGKRWRPARGADPGYRSPSLCDGDNRIDADASGLLEKGLFPATARVKELKPIGAGWYLVAFSELPGDNAAPHTYPLFLALTRPGAAHLIGTAALGSDANYCGLFADLSSGLVAVATAEPFADSSYAALHLFWISGFGAGPGHAIQHARYASSTRTRLPGARAKP